MLAREEALLERIAIALEGIINRMDNLEETVDRHAERLNDVIAKQVVSAIENGASCAWGAD
jgi:hypothetical protein